MKCLTRQQLAKVKNEQEWQQIIEQYQYHCTVCDRLLEQHQQQIEQRLKQAREFYDKLWDERPEDFSPEEALSEEEVKKVITGYVPELYQRTCELVGQREGWGWEACLRIVRSLHQRCFSSLDQLISEMWKTFWRTVAQMPAIQEEGPFDLPEDWQEQIAAIFTSGEVAVSPQQQEQNRLLQALGCFAPSRLEMISEGVSLPLESAADEASSSLSNRIPLKEDHGRPEELLLRRRDQQDRNEITLWLLDANKKMIEQARLIIGGQTPISLSLRGGKGVVASSQFALPVVAILPGGETCTFSHYEEDGV